ncbi:MAG: exodeoxyribonuclease V subunit gamma, partial [Desulfobacterales bacterium]|nr:exodeoxyribonuclease V subunit gamma [Desulfobacterales bacterium]
MPGMSIYTSNRLEILGEALARVIRIPPGSAFTPEVIVVQSKGMQRWISLELARHTGICANCQFPFPNRFLQDISASLLGESPQMDLFTPEIMAFRIMKILPACLSLPGFESLGRYLADDPDGLKLFQLSGKIAGLFDQYQVFRPEMIFQWEKGLEEPLPDHQWQAHLWRELSLNLGGNAAGHRASLQKHLMETIHRFSGDVSLLPERLAIFGISSLPPFYFRAFAALSHLIEVNLFLMNPCREYWADILSEREIRKTKKRYGSEFSEQDLFLEKGNPLLASMGMLGRDFFRLISETDFELVELFDDPPSVNLLSGIQSDIVNLTGPPAEPVSCPATNQTDPSVQIHSCHSPMREIEVLHNQLLDMFEQDPVLLPKDIVVMTPDIQTYAPFIQAVFDAQTEPAHRIPFSIADQSMRSESRIIEAFFAILDLKGSRFSATDLMGLLESPHIRDRFDISESDMPTVERWVRETGIRWGIDQHTRESLGLPGIEENTWKAGLDRMLLGYAMPGQGRRMFGGLLAYDPVEGNDAALLGRLIRFVNTVVERVTAFGRARTPAQWQQCLDDLLGRFFPADDDAMRQIQTIRSVIHDMGSIAGQAGFDREVKFEVIRAYLGHQLERDGFGSGFISGGVTFCAMLPMRSIPFDVICLVGMNIDAFPRDSRPPAFDLMASRPQPGDRSRRNDDRYLFLEAVMSARKVLYISYVGQSIQDNSTIPPCVPVSELLDYIRDSYGILQEKIVTRHRLQAFSPWYFTDGSALFSYSEEDLAAGASLAGAPEDREERAFIEGALPPAPDEYRCMDPAHLARFYANPARLLLKNRLGIFLEEPETVLDEREYFSTEGLNRYQIHQDLYAYRQSAPDLKAFFPLEKASGRLPHAAVGEVAYSQMSLDTDRFAATVNRYTHGKIPRAVEIDLKIDGFHLCGKIDGLYEQRLVCVRFARKKVRDYLSAWIAHLALCSSPQNAFSGTCLVCSDGRVEYSPVKDATDILARLLHLYWTGLTRPLHFFP